MQNFCDRRSFPLSALRGAVEFTQLVAFIFFTPILDSLYFTGGLPDGLKLVQAFGMLVAGKMSWALSGIVVTHPGDQLCRNRGLAVSLLLMALPALLIGLLPTRARSRAVVLVLLFCVGAVRGAAIGGRANEAWEFGCDHAHSSRAGAAIGALIAGIASGLLLGSLAARTETIEFATNQAMVFAWRVALIAGGGDGLLTVYLRRFLCDTSVCVELAWCRTLATIEGGIKSARSGSLAERRACTRPEPAPMPDLAKDDLVENGVSRPCAPREIEPAETSELPAGVERWRWIVLGLGWGW
ncbi:hypothetical protein BH160DRAFT_3657 [Burkholderia sp. H160]|nr:hypothetical protein BH160DRAFT_3657 [Burkholderia sp. H160]